MKDYYWHFFPGVHFLHESFLKYKNKSNGNRKCIVYNSYNLKTISLYLNFQKYSSLFWVIKWKITHLLSRYNGYLQRTVIFHFLGVRVIKEARALVGTDPIHPYKSTRWYLLIVTAKMRVFSGAHIGGTITEMGLGLASGQLVLWISRAWGMWVAVGLVNVVWGHVTFVG